jgi:hypothetical protein
MLVKSGRNEFELTEEDVILDNGSCIQLVTRKVGIGWNQSNAIISKANWKKYLKTAGFEVVKVVKGEKKDLKYYKLKGE